MSTTILFLTACAASLILAAMIAWLVTGRLIPILQNRAILDQPNHRSSHTLPTPRGGGWGILAAWGITIAALAAFTPLPQKLLWLIPALLMLVWVSWQDDLGHVAWWQRMGVQKFAVILGLQALPAHAPIFGGWLPEWLEMLGMVLFWLWFINLTNFIDGIDGITGINGFVLGLGVAVIAMLTIDRPWLTPFSLILTGSMLGFLIHNWHPARIFMGDVGSVPIGFISAFLLLMLACHGHVVAAMLLPLVPFCDATHTLLTRLMQGKKLTEAHRDHAYQAGVIKGLNSPQVVTRIAAVNVILMILACMSVVVGALEIQLIFLGVGICITGILLYSLHATKPRPSSKL